MSTNATRMPVVFFGHGSPMNALDSNRYTDAWRDIGRTVPRPKAILCISAHWTTRGSAVTAMASPRTIHDFGGFPEQLFAVRYAAPGQPALARRVRELLAPQPVALDEAWGLDHGTWSVLVHAYPDAEVPVVQLSIDATQPAAFHYELGKHLLPLRDEGVLVIGSGNVVHNLRIMNWGNQGAAFDWAVRFNDRVRELLKSSDHSPLLAYERLGQDARLAIPTPEHYLPLLYCLGMQRADDAVAFRVDGIEHGSIGMLAVTLGAAAPGRA